MRISDWSSDVCSSDLFAPERISFTGTGVSPDDLDRLLQQPRLTINCDTIGMIRRIGERCPGREIGIRVNPGLGAGYADAEKLVYAGRATTKFGIYREPWPDAVQMARRFRTEERRVRKECVSTGSSRWSAYH